MLPVAPAAPGRHGASARDPRRPRPEGARRGTGTALPAPGPRTRSNPQQDRWCHPEKARRRATGPTRRRGTLQHRRKPVRKGRNRRQRQPPRRRALTGSRHAHLGVRGGTTLGNRPPNRLSGSRCQNASNDRQMAVSPTLTDRMHSDKPGEPPSFKATASLTPDKTMAAVRHPPAVHQNDLIIREICPSAVPNNPGNQRSNNVRNNNCYYVRVPRAGYYYLSGDDDDDDDRRRSYRHDRDDDDD